MPSERKLIGVGERHVRLVPLSAINISIFIENVQVVRDASTYLQSFNDIRSFDLEILKPDFAEIRPPINTISGHFEHWLPLQNKKRCKHGPFFLSKTAFRYSLPVLKIYSARNVHYKFSVLAVNIGTQP